MGYKSVLDFGREAKVGYPHNQFDYPTKILPQVISDFIDKFTDEGDVILDPFAGSGTLAVEAALKNRCSISIDINPRAIEIIEKKLKMLISYDLFTSVNIDCQKFYIGDARSLNIEDNSIDAIITDIPYHDMIKYSDLEGDLSNIPKYEDFLNEIYKSCKEMYRVLKYDKYCIIFVADYRIAKSRMIIPIHSDIISIMLDLGFTLFDTYIWRYYRSGGFRPFGKRPYQSMNVHSYVLVFYKHTLSNIDIVKNSGVKYRRRLIEKIIKNNVDLK